MNILRKILFGTTVASVFATALVVWGETQSSVQPRPKTVQQVVQPSLQDVQQVIASSTQVVRQVTEKKPQSGGEHKAAASVRPKPKNPVAQARQTKNMTQPLVIRMVPMEKLLKESASSDQAKAQRQASVFAKTKRTADSETADGLGLDIGKGLLLPVPDSVMIAPNDKPEGFHVGVDYRLDQKWDVTGVAGVATFGGIVTSPVKPSFNQVGVRANYRF